MMFVIRRISDGAYVCQPGQEKSYTQVLERAWVFPSWLAADRQRCVESESVVPVASLLRVTAEYS